MVFSIIFFRWRRGRKVAVKKLEVFGDQRKCLSLQRVIMLRICQMGRRLKCCRRLRTACGEWSWWLSRGNWRRFCQSRWILKLWLRRWEWLQMDALPQVLQGLHLWTLGKWGGRQHFLVAKLPKTLPLLLLQGLICIWGLVRERVSRYKYKHLGSVLGFPWQIGPSTAYLDNLSNFNEWYRCKDC